MRQRIFTMLALWMAVGVALGSAGVAGGQVLLFLVALRVTYELALLLQKIGLKVQPIALLGALALGLGGHLWGGIAGASLGTSLGLIGLLGAHWSASAATLPAALGAVIAVGLGMGSLNAVAHLPAEYFPEPALGVVVWIIATVKLSDAGAYLIGSQLGRHPLTKISPGKTVEGLAGALISGLIMGVLGAPLFYPVWLGPVLGVLLAFTGSVGDLLESLLKRLAGVKDSGRILPGIGGLLDLCDSLIVAAPIAYVALKYLAKI